MLKIGFLRLFKWKNACRNCRQRQFLINIWEICVTPTSDSNLHISHQEPPYLSHLRRAIVLRSHLEYELMIYAKKRF